MSISQIIASARPAEGGLDVLIPDTWLQGRTCYGGLSSALALHAAQGLTDDLPPLRSASVSFIGPLTGEVQVRAKLLRRGRNATWAQTEISGDGALGYIATFVFMGPMDSSIHLNDFPPPTREQPEDGAEAGKTPVPGFVAGNIEWRHALPRQATPQPEIARWMRFNDRVGLDPMIEVVAIADALPPGVLPLASEVAAVSSMTWICNLLTPQPKTRDGWWLLRAWGNYAENGCSSQSMGIWNTDGEPVASGMQSIALFG